MLPVKGENLEKNDFACSGACAGSGNADGKLESGNGGADGKLESIPTDYCGAYSCSGAGSAGSAALPSDLLNNICINFITSLKPDCENKKNINIFTSIPNAIKVLFENFADSVIFQINRGNRTITTI